MVNTSIVILDGTAQTTKSRTEPPKRKILSKITKIMSERGNCSNFHICRIVRLQFSNLWVLYGLCSYINIYGNSMHFTKNQQFVMFSRCRWESLPKLSFCSRWCVFFRTVAGCLGLNVTLWSLKAQLKANCQSGIWTWVIVTNTHQSYILQEILLKYKRITRPLWVCGVGND